MTKTDLLVVGGGPAGAAIATLAAQKGAKVVLLEKDKFPRDKVCGEFLSAEGCAVLQRLNMLQTIKSLGAKAMTSCLLADAKGRYVTSPLPQAALGISRATLDTLLLAKAHAADVNVMEQTTAVAPIVERGVVKGVTTKTDAYRAKLVVAADGRRSMLQRALNPDAGDPLKTSPESWFGFGAHFSDTTRGLGGRIELFVFDGGYAGLGPIEGGRLDLALIARVEALRACGNSPRRLFDERIKKNPLLASRLDDLEPLSAWRAIGPLKFGVRKPASHGALFLGDAAGTIDPFSGEGISNALVAAELAIPYVERALHDGFLSADAARRWTSTWRSTFAPVTRRAGMLGQLFRHPRPAAMALRLLQFPPGARMLPSLVAASRTSHI
ncbi:MAG TPA: FAD-dependent monooxygenase [Candidatus Polarisedimenticolaceae bacterium]|nr:FAD-dependent monooxygenase [Candidatus Polarisedimenticolaceae bacterium]